jgi:hypothetical protein
VSAGRLSIVAGATAASADERLTAVLGNVEAIGPDPDASGVVGDGVPLSAFDDAVRLFSPDKS